MMIRLLLLLILACPVGAQAPRWVAVCPSGWEHAVAPLEAHRRTQGYDTHTVVTRNVAKVVEEHRPDYLLIVGDDTEDDTEASWRIRSVTRQLYRWRSVQPKTFPSDAAFGDVDGDLMPDLHVGRIPARTDKEVAVVVKKIIAYETRPPSGNDLRVVAWGGAPGYGPALDKQATKMLVDTVRKHAPKWCEPWMISAAPGDPFCGWPPDQPSSFSTSIRSGSLLSAFVAHASSRHVFSMKWGNQRIIYTARHLLEACAQGEPLAPMVFLTCDSGRFQEERHCLAESALFAPGGPVAAIAATTESHPLTNYFTGKSMLQSLGTAKPRATLGSVWIEGQRRGKKARSLLIELALKDAEGSLEAKIDTKKLRRDQPLMFALLGDPATRMKIPKPLEAVVEKVGDRWKWRVTKKPGSGHLSVAHHDPRPPRLKPISEVTPASARKLHEQANRNLAWLPDKPFALDSEQPWEGTYDRPGWVRLVTHTSTDTYVAVLKLE